MIGQSANGGDERVDIPRFPTSSPLLDFCHVTRVAQNSNVSNTLPSLEESVNRGGNETLETADVYLWRTFLKNTPRSLLRQLTFRVAPFFHHGCFMKPPLRNDALSLPMFGWVPIQVKRAFRCIMGTKFKIRHLKCVSERR
ncbi:hypothetical protein TNCV_3849071 [Trichonephila clavipes]|uniref:Uncharacterized protein n=1 Tax=Trichonephila clavipes TaxID=2585209 RepID=A0A8X6V035_TRICX|nr:hypothetical protein TNCV_3849071 [Trichonephila clavipes]